jgi:hypothetical protein
MDKKSKKIQNLNPKVKVQTNQNQKIQKRVPKN